MNKLCAFLVLFTFLAGANSVVLPCTEYNAYAQYHAYTAYAGYYYSCGWWGWSTCYATYSYTAYYATYYSQLDCCSGYSGAKCLPVCGTPCGTNKECSLPNTCTCIEGWEGSDCLTDIDECVKETDKCEYSETCVNIAGSYNCDCPDPSDKLGTDGHRCLSPITNLKLTPDRRSINVQWDHPKNLSDDGMFDYYLVECEAKENTTVIYSTSDSVGWVKEFDVGPVTPFRNYTCSVTAVTKMNGMSYPTSAMIATLQDKPDGPPRDLKVDTIDSKILAITWTAPEVPNGIIEYHRLYINYMNSSRIYEIEVDAAFSLFFLEFLYPHQTVAISMTATTGGGEGPASAWVSNTTAQSEPGRVSDMDVAIVNDNSAELIWNPPESLNGIVLSYHIYLYKVENGERISLEEWDLDHDDELKVKYHEFMPYVPYEFVVTAATIAGKGEIAPFKFFTRQDTPKVSPTVTQSNRISADQMYLTWNSLNQDDLQGFFVDYIVKYYTTAVPNDCSSPKDMMMTTTTDAFVSIDNLDPHSAYCVKIAASSTAGAGVYTDFIYIDAPESSKFELHLNGVRDCQDYADDNDDSTNKLAEIADQLTDILNNYCKCNVQTTYFDDMRFICRNPDDDRILVQGSIVGTALATSTKLVQYLDDWRKTDSPHFVILGLQLYVNKTCEVALDDFGSHTQCEVPERPPDAIEDTTGSTDTAILFGFIGVVLVAVIVVIFILVIVIAVVLVKRSGKRNISGQEVKFVNSAARMGVSNPIGGENDDIDEKQLIENMD